MKPLKAVETLKEVAKRLHKLFPKAYKPDKTPAEQMVFTILSQNTNDKNAEKCLQNLTKLTNGSLSEVFKLNREEVIAAIKPCGMYNQKIKAIFSVMRDWKEIKEKLKKLPVKDAIKTLTAYPYVGTKTARVVLTFSFNKNTFPVDTHCNRVLKRLGIFPKSWSKDRISEFMEKHFNGDFNRKLHYDLIRFGRAICTARKPKCEGCPLSNLCRFYMIRGKR